MESDGVDRPPFSLSLLNDLFTSIDYKKLHFVGLDKNSNAFEAISKINLTELILNNLNIRSIDENIFKRFNSLKTLNLSFNPIRHITKYSFKGLDKLESLDLNSCGISLIDNNSFDVLPSLQNLSLMENSLEDMAKNERDEFLEHIKKRCHIRYRH
jgi:Leucine-rich repeat (LRR) protein